MAKYSSNFLKKLGKTRKIHKYGNALKKAVTRKNVPKKTIKNKKKKTIQILAAHKLSLGENTDHSGLYSGEVASNKAIKVLEIMDKAKILIVKHIAEISKLNINNETKMDDIKFFKDRLRRITKKYKAIITTNKIIRNSKDVYKMLLEVLEVLPLIDNDIEEEIAFAMNNESSGNADLDSVKKASLNAHGDAVGDAELDKLLLGFKKFGL
jgi:hypothetical protein